MKLRVFILASLVITFAGCSKQQSDSGTDVTTKMRGEANVAGIVWSVPADWTDLAPRPMRTATYGIPPAEGDAEGGECAVFYFGTGQGGDVEANVERWIGQFDQPKSERSTRTVSDMKVYMVRASGTYLAHGGGMMMQQEPEEKAGYELRGAIVEAPEGMVFFKFTGPGKTVESAEKTFNDLISTVKKQ